MDNSSRQFEGLLDRFFERLLKDVPTFAAVQGIRSAEGKLGRLTLEFHQHREKERQFALRAMDEVSPRDLNSEQQLDRLALSSLLLKECEDYARERHTLEPNGPAQLLDILLHELMRGDDEPARAARNLRSLLKQAPDFLDEAARVVRRPERVWRRVMEQNVSGSQALLDGVAKFLQSASPRADDGALIRATQSALNRYRDSVAGRSLAPENSFAVGEA